MMRKILPSTLLRYLSVMNNGEIDFFLGSGASAQAGIPTGGTMVWDFKRLLYCSENHVSPELFKDLHAETTRNTLQDYFDKQGGHPALWSTDEYAHYFELCHPTAISRERYIQHKVRDVSPSIGHLCLGDLFINKRIASVWTTNFDELVEAGIKALSPQHSFNVYSTANSSSAPQNTLSSIIKLHGDYRYDHIKNTPKELQELESSMQYLFEQSLINKGLVVIGYSGSDESIMNVLENGFSNPDFLKYGLIWAVHAGSKLPDRLSALIEKACQTNENSGIVEIQGFDDLMHSLYTTQASKNNIIENLWKDYDHRKLPISFNMMSISNFTKFNTFESVNIPSCAVFDTDITSWKQLREITGESGIIAALFSRRVYCFEEADKIMSVFGGHIKSAITIEHISNRILYRTDSIYLGMLYSLMKNDLTNNLGLVEYRRNKYYDPTISRRDNDLNCIVYEAIEVSLSVCRGKIYLSVVPTSFVTQNNGNPFDRFENQKKINASMAKIYNKPYNAKLKEWNQLLSKSNSFTFVHGSFSLSFNRVALSSGGTSRATGWPTKFCYRFSEPEMQFSVTDASERSINQLKGISRFAPLDCSYYAPNTYRSPIELAIIAPQEDINKLQRHLAKFNQPILPASSREGFLPQYTGFDSIFKRGIIIPSESDTSKVFLYPRSQTGDLNEVEYTTFIKRLIDRVASQNNCDVAIVYIPAAFSRFRENHLTDFNLHDAIKLYATDHSIKVQFIEERSIDYYDQCKVMWGLSTSLYAKASGVLWQPVTMNSDTAFVGVSYAISKNKGTCIGCSQLFDSTGTGIRLLLRKIDSPGFWGRNPYMKCDEARSMMSALRDQYYNSGATNQLKRIVVHKTTPFTQEEIKGFTQALEGIDDIELLQIQEYSPWRAIRYDTPDFRSDPANFAIHRGTAMPIDDDSFLLWTHGCVQHNDLSGSGYNYYKGGRGVPTPLLIKRYYGKATGDILVNEILMLTKMNWNSGDSLYKQLPVTLDFAKVLSRMSKQDEAIYNKPYDFRYFM